MTVKNTIQLRFMHDKHSGIGHFKTVTGVLFKMEKKTMVLKMALLKDFFT